MVVSHHVGAGSLEEQPVLLTTESLLQPQDFTLIEIPMCYMLKRWLGKIVSTGCLLLKQLIENDSTYGSVLIKLTYFIKPR